MLEKVRIYHVDGDVADLATVDANEATHNHPHEWSRDPWSSEQRKAAQLAAPKGNERSTPASMKNGHLLTNHIDRANAT